MNFFKILNLLALITISNVSASENNSSFNAEFDTNIQTIPYQETVIQELEQLNLSRIETNNQDLETSFEEEIEDLLDGMMSHTSSTNDESIN